MNKLKRRIDRACGKWTALHDSIFLDAMLPEFKAANAELLKAIKMNDKSGAIPYTELLEINKAMKENDADKAGQALKKVQEKLTKAEKALDEEIKTATAKLAESKKASATAVQTLKAKKALASVFDKAKSACEAAKQSPKNASKLTALTDKLKEYGDLSKRVSQIVTMSASGKDIAKQLDMLKKSIDAAEKKYKKDVATVEKNVQKSKDELEKATLNQKVAQTKRDSFQKERLYIANVVKQMPSGDLRQSGVKTNPIFEQMIKAKNFIENNVKNEMAKQVQIMKEKQKKYYKNAKDYSDELKEANRIKNNLLSDIKNLVVKAKELKLSPKCIKVANDVANLVKKGDSRWDSPKDVKDKILRCVGKNWLSLTEEKRKEFRGLAEMVRSDLAVYEKFVFRGDLERSRQLLNGGKKTVVEYMKTPEGDEAYRDAFAKLSQLVAKIRNIFPNFRPNDDVRIFKWDYFEKPNMFIGALIKSVQDSFEDSV